MRNRSKVLVAALLIVFGAVALFSIAREIRVVNLEWFVRALRAEPTQEIVVIPSLIREQIAVGETDCFSFFSQRANIFGTDHSSDGTLIPIAETALAPLRYRERCPYTLTFNIIRQHVGAVRYGGDAAELLMSFNLCSLQGDGSINAGHCTSKNVYLLRNDLSPDTAFGIGIKAFALKQHEEWTVMRMNLR